MSPKELLSKTDEPVCRIRLDRVLFVAELPDGRLPHLPGYQVEGDHFVHPQTTLRAYRRVRKLKNSKTGAHVGIQYPSVCSWLRNAKVTINAGQAHELLLLELERVYASFEEPCLLQFELAFDFSRRSKIDRDFVRAHARFGKSHPVGGNLYATLTYGTRKSDSYVRCYDKPDLECYRVEVQVHSSWLRARNIQEPDQICRVAGQILESRFSFVQIDFDRLYAYFFRKQGPLADKLVEHVRRRSHVLHRALKYLKHDLGVQNPHRFLKPLQNIDQEVRTAFHDWQYEWGRGDGR